MLAEANTLLEIFKFQAPMGAEPPPLGPIYSICEFKSSTELLFEIIVLLNVLNL